MSSRISDILLDMQITKEIGKVVSSVAEWIVLLMRSININFYSGKQWAEQLV